MVVAGAARGFAYSGGGAGRARSRGAGGQRVALQLRHQQQRQRSAAASTSGEWGEPWKRRLKISIKGRKKKERLNGQRGPGEEMRKRVVVEGATTMVI